MKKTCKARTSARGDALLTEWEKVELLAVRTNGERDFTFLLNDHIRIVDNSLGPCVMVADFEKKSEFEELVRAYNYTHERLPDHYTHASDVFPDIGLYCWRSKEYVFSRKHLLVVNSMLNFIEKTTKTVPGVRRKQQAKRTRDMEIQTDPESIVNHSHVDYCGRSPGEEGYVMKRRRTLHQRL